MSDALRISDCEPTPAMPRLRHGIDICSIERMTGVWRRHGRDFLRRVCTPTEIVDFDAIESRERQMEFLTGRFAAKEAAAKALGTGLWSSGIGWRAFEVVRVPGGAPVMRLHGAAAELWRSLGGLEMAISISHDAGIALASCVCLMRGADVAGVSDKSATCVTASGESAANALDAFPAPPGDSWP